MRGEEGNGRRGGREWAGCILDPHLESHNMPCGLGVAPYRRLPRIQRLDADRNGHVRVKTTGRDLDAGDAVWGNGADRLVPGHGVDEWGDGGDARGGGEALEWREHAAREGHADLEARVVWGEALWRYSDSRGGGDAERVIPCGDVGLQSSSQALCDRVPRDEVARCCAASHCERRH